MTQNEMIIEYLKKHERGISPKEAVDLFGCMRLSGRIYELKDLGYPIKTEYETKENRFGKKVTYARYKLVKEDQGNN